MIFVNSVTNAIYNMVSSNSVLVSSGVNICVNDLYNLDPNQTPWLGIYNAPVTVEPWRLNIGQPWKTIYNPVIYIQEIGYDEHFNTTQALDELLNHTLTAINCNNSYARTLDGTVNIVKGFEIEPFELEIDEDNPIFSYQIQITAEAFR